MTDFVAWWRIVSENLPHWVRVTLLASAVVGEGVRQLVNFLHPLMDHAAVGNLVDYAAVSPWGWTIFGMAICFPIAMAWRLFGRKLFKVANTYEAASEYIRVIKLAMVEAKLSKTEQQFQWRAVMQKLADELRVGEKPPEYARILDSMQRTERDVLT